MSDERLMERYQQGDENAFAELYHRYSKRVYGYLSKRVRDPERVNEVFQMIFLKLHHSRPQYRASDPFAPWLFTICRTTLIDAARTGKVYDDRKMVELSAEQQAANSPSHLDVDLEGLSLEQQELIRMRYAEDLDFDEMAKRLDSNAPTIRKRVSRALQRLKKRLNHE